MRVREFIPDIFSDFIPTQRMYDLFNTDMYKGKVNEVKDKSKHVEIIEFLTPTEAFLHELELQQHDLTDLEDYVD